MWLRSEALLPGRPSIPGAEIRPEMCADERFQNQTLRPIIKFQNDLFLAVFRNYIRKHKNAYHNLNQEERGQYIVTAIQRDIKFRNALKGMIIGQFTIEEYEQYILNSSSLNKRMMNMVIERLKDQMQVLERAAFL